MTSRPSTAAPILAALVIVLVPLAIYVGGYIYLEETVAWSEDASIIRVYPNAWQATLFRPLALIESLSRRMDVTVIDGTSWKAYLDAGSQ